ncbi:ferric-rhodotorulic acid/ferric-coprogen receptor FhuE [Pantoea rodasii]|uniref:Ferric-rhodotorulic acid/ferric-coprogen receptor FhuE n=1 Tax=Pantoea rodasii TaxID=1076549 RepID=A0A2M9WEC9_9GAMM|nr:ferric-rhodotorulic acid/ferric-coprogen receptor FhuE [Pantoea rodasii]ORM57810.1 ferric-rhodotorulic acid/ferric-coprogen receptor FhuE [Pantoea rodasii]PJZ05923.1 ferric-rhodotorulic acid/ferric-coprogen receptor FhuE [Pantoea rodasii]
MSRSSHQASLNAGNHAGAIQALPVISLLALIIATALHSPKVYAAETTSQDQTLEVTAAAGSSESNQDTDYNVPVTRAATKLALTARDTPQSISVISKQRMQDQKLQTLNDVLTNTTGISEFNSGANRSNFYSRGFMIDNYQIDGVPALIDSAWNLGDTLSDTAVYDRVEVVRGATGLMTGAGSPAASVNMVHKQADSKTFQGNLSASYGSWDTQRYVADLSGPLTESGNVRGRVVAGYQDGDSWLDHYHTKKKFLYGTVAADLTDSTTLSVGYDYQETNISGATWGGLPTFYVDGSKTNYSRSTNLAPDWAYNNSESKKVFANLKQTFNNGWELNLSGSHTEATMDSKLLYIDGYFDKSTGIGIGPYAGYDLLGGTGYNTAKRKEDTADAYVTGPYELFGRQHELMAGVTYIRQHDRYVSASTSFTSADVGDFNDWGNYPEPDWDDQALSQDNTIRQKSAYIATRVSLADPLHLILGARYTQYNANTLTQNMEKNNVTPYAGLIYDINDTYSAYASYTSIFKPQTYRNAQGAYLSPVTGKSYETGIKGDWMNSRVTASLAVFRIEQDHLGATDYALVSGSTDYAYYEQNGTVSKGVEFEINGAVTDNLQMTFGATRYVAKDGDDAALNPTQPRTSLKLFTRYRLPMLQDLTVGGGVNWQTHTWDNVAGPGGTSTLYAEQGSYALVDLFSRYQVTKQLSVQANLNNLFDKTYNIDVGRNTVYGEPRNVTISANYQF